MGENRYALKCFLTLVFVAFLYVTACAETTDRRDLLKDLYGAWFVSCGYPDSNGTLVFSRNSPGPKRFNWGDRIEIYPDGNFLDAYSAKCGNDERIHSSRGVWTVNATTMVFTATVPVALRNKTYRITHLSADKLVFERLKE